MPYKRSYKRKYPSKRRSYKRSRNIVAKTPGGLAPKTVVKMRYCDQKVLVSTSGTVATQVYRCNSIFDPDYTGVGHQPIGHDEWNQMYNNYKVTKAKLTIQATNTGSAPVVLSINRGDSTTGSTGAMSAICEQPYTKWMQLGGSSGGLSEKKLQMGFVASKQWPNLKEDDTLRPPFGADPGEGAYFVVQLQATDASSSASIPVFVTIDYTVELTSPTILTQS